MHKKYNPFILIFSVFVFLLVLSFVPTEFNLFHLKLRKVDITLQLKNLIFPVNEIDSLKVSKDTLKVENLCIDSLMALTFKLNLDSILEQEKNDLRITSFSNEKLLFSRFFPALKSARDSSSKARIAYFGDSMIEGDLISQTLRNDLQNKIGGNGVGFVPITSIVSEFRKSIKHEFSDDWREYSIQKSKELKNFAPSGFVFNPRVITNNELKDTVSKQKVSYVRYTTPSDTYKRLSFFYSTKLYYGKAPAGTYIKYYIDSKLYKTILTGQNEVNELILNKNKPYKELLIEFYTDTIFDVYGVSFESSKGVFIDNYAVRGNLGMALQKIPENILLGFNSYMNYSLLIFQFGLNVASPEARGFTWYEEAMVKVVNYYKRMIPNADILVISIGDKSHKYNMEYVTQPGIPRLVESQRNIARRTQSCFWNLYQSMGGYNSMKTWVESTKPLASKDYAHINFGGAEKISKILSGNIFNEFKLFEYTLLKEKEKQQLIEAILSSNSSLVENFISFDKQLAFLKRNRIKSFELKDTLIENISTQTFKIEDDTNSIVINDSIIDTYEYRVQISASKVELDIHEFDYLLEKAKGKMIRRIKHRDGFYRYYITPYTDFDLAQACADSIINDVNDAFVVGFINGDRAKIEKVKEKQLDIERKLKNQQLEIKTVVKAKDTKISTTKVSFSEKNSIVSKDFPENMKILNFKDLYNKSFMAKDTMPNYICTLWKTDSINENIKKEIEMPVFRVQFCASEVELDKNFYQNIIDYFGDSLIIISKDSDGLIRYMLGNFVTYEEAEQVLNKVFELKQDGIITAYQYNKRIKTEKAISIIKKYK